MELWNSNNSRRNHYRMAEIGGRIMKNVKWNNMILVKKNVDFPTREKTINPKKDVSETKTNTSSSRGDMNE